MFHPGLLFVFVLTQSVFGYESVYDIIERRNHRRIGSRDRYMDPGAFSDSVYFAYDNKPGGIFNYVRPIENFGYRYFGNGYDNLGNGNIPDRDRLFYLPHGTFRPRYHRHFGERFESAYDYPNFFYINPHRDFIRGNKDELGVSRTNSFASSKEGSNHRHGEESYGNKQGSVVNDSNRKEHYGEMSFTDRNGENKSSLRSNRYSKKGHVTKGFSNHHHKDETGNSTTFYDEYSDHGGQSDFRDVADGFGTKTTLDHVTNGEDAKFFREDEGKIGNYGSGSVKDDEKSERDSVLRENVFDKGENFHSHGGNTRSRLNFVRNSEDFDLPTYAHY